MPPTAEAIAPDVSTIITTESNTLTLDTSGGYALSGALTAGDDYSFYIDETMATDGALDPNLNGVVGLTLSQTLAGSSVPLPRSAPAALLPLLLVGWIARRRAAAAR
jgi:hypothetical protein